MCSSATSWVWSRSDDILTTNEPLQNLFESVLRQPLQEVSVCTREQLPYSHLSKLNEAAVHGHSTCVLGHGTDQAWKQPCPGMHESCLRPPLPYKELSDCSTWQPVTFKPKYGCTRWRSWKGSQVVDVGVSTGENNMHSNKEDSTLHGSALHQYRDKLEG